MERINAEDREQVSKAVAQAKEDVLRTGRVLPSTLRQGRQAAAKIRTVGK